MVRKLETGHMHNSGKEKGSLLEGNMDSRGKDFEKKEKPDV